MNNIRTQRRALGLTLKDLASAIGVTESTVSHYETGRRAPDPAMLSKIANELGVTVDYLLDREDSFSYSTQTKENSVLAGTLRSLRKKNGDTQESLAAKINIPARTYASWERGEREMPNDVLVSIADLYDVTVDYLLGREENPLLSAYEELHSRPLILDGGPIRGLTDDKPETQARIESIMAKLAQLDEADRRAAEGHIDFLLERKLREGKI